MCVCVCVCVCTRARAHTHTLSGGENIIRSLAAAVQASQYGHCHAMCSLFLHFVTVGHTKCPTAFPVLLLRWPLISPVLLHIHALSCSVSQNFLHMNRLCAVVGRAAIGFIENLWSPYVVRVSYKSKAIVETSKAILIIKCEDKYY